MSEINNFKLNFEKLMSQNPNDSLAEINLRFHEIPEFANIICANLEPGDWLFLDGDLGSGKTAFTKELSISLGANEFSTSPTFSILNSELLNPLKGIKNSKILKLIHLDLYRLKNGKELIYLGLENEFNLNSSICVFEWPYNVEEEDFESLFNVTKCPRPKRIIEILINLNSDSSSRNYTIKKIL
jgi:tRNA threonylcarbamoyladenosine biosynthesis protein TsaE